VEMTERECVYSGSDNSRLKKKKNESTQKISDTEDAIWQIEKEEKNRGFCLCLKIKVRSNTAEKKSSFKYLLSRSKQK
jgi:hypothetical protein